MGFSALHFISLSLAITVILNTGPEYNALRVSYGRVSGCIKATCSCRYQCPISVPGECRSWVSSVDGAGEGVVRSRNHMNTRVGVSTEGHWARRSCG